MAIDTIVREVEKRSNRLTERGNAPKDDGRPDDQMRPTSLATGQMLPPWIHNQELPSQTTGLLILSLVSAMWLLTAHRDKLEVSV